MRCWGRSEGRRIMSSGFLLIALLLGQTSRTQNVQPAVESPAVEQRSITAMTLEITELLKRESKAENVAERVAAVQRLIEIHREIVADSRFTTNELLPQQRHKVVTRLTSVRDEIKRRLAAEKRRSKSAKQLDAEETSRQLAAHYAVAGQSLTGPVAFVAGGGAVANDFSQELIDLIQTTIDPASWNVNGGRGSIRYYSPVFALVVRASSEVHSQLSDELGGLRGEVK